jgi:hypothetical protein
VASTVTLDSGQAGRGASGDKYVRRGVLNLGVYATNGVAVTKAQFDLPVSLDHLDVGSGSGYVFEWDKTNGKIKAFIDKTPAAATPLAEVANAVDITAVVVRFFAQGN